MTVFVLLALVVVVILVVVLVALGVRASRQARDGEEEWVDEEQPTRGRRGAPGPDGSGDAYAGYERRVAGAPIGGGTPLGAPVEIAPHDPGYDNQGYDNGYDQGYDGYEQASYDQAPYDQAPYDQAPYDQGYDQGQYEPAYDQPAAQPPAPAPQPPAPQPLSRRAQATEEMEDDDYWATITFDKPKFPWQHDTGHRPQGEDPLARVEEHEEFEAPAPTAHAGPAGPQPGYGMSDVPVAGFPSPGPSTGDNLLAGSPLPRGDLGPTGPIDPLDRQSDPFDRPGDPFDRPGADRQADPFARPGDDPFARPGESTDPFARPGDSFDRPADPFDRPADPFDRPGDPFERPAASAGAAPTAPQQLPDPLGYGGDPLGGPREQDRSLGSDTQFFSTSEIEVPAPPAHPSTMATQNFSVGSVGSVGPVSSTGSGSGPLGASTPPPSAPPAAPLNGGGPSRSGTAPLPTPSAPAKSGGSSAHDSDAHRLPTVDELLQRIQTAKSSEAAASGGSGPSYGGSDPLSDPLSPSPTNWSSGGSSSSFEQDPLNTSNGYLSAPPPSGPSSSGGYPSAPAYGSDPLGSGNGSYGSGSSNPARYGDFSGSSYSGGGDPLSREPRGYPDAPASGGYGAQGGSYPADPAYGGPGQDQPRTAENSPDDWDTYRGPRR